MVVFTCNNCGESLQKPTVQKHIAVLCKKKFTHPVSLCCVDCLVDFNKNTYADHTKCISELERYSAPGFVPKSSSNKNERKQQSWIKVVEDVLRKGSYNKAEKQVLHAISGHSNVPRKKSKFLNFINNVCKHIRPSKATVDAVYNLIESEFALQKTVDAACDSANEKHPEAPITDENGTNENNNNNNNDEGDGAKDAECNNADDGTNGISVQEKTDKNTDKIEYSHMSKKERKQLLKRQKYEAELVCDENCETPAVDQVADLNDARVGNEKILKKKKRKRLMEAAPNGTVENKKMKILEEPDSVAMKAQHPSKKFEWFDIIRQILMKQSDQNISYKRLCKKVINEYQSIYNDGKSYEQLQATLMKKLKKCHDVILQNDRVTLRITDEELQ